MLCIHQAERLAKSAVKPVAPVVKKKVIVDDTVRLALELQEKLGGPTRKPKYVLRRVVLSIEQAALPVVTCDFADFRVFHRRCAVLKQTYRASKFWHSEAGSAALEDVAKRVASDPGYAGKRDKSHKRSHSKKQTKQPQKSLDGGSSSTPSKKRETSQPVEKRPAGSALNAIRTRTPP